MDQNAGIQSPDSNIMKIDDVIKNEKIPSKYSLKKNRTTTNKINSYNNNNNNTDLLSGLLPNKTNNYVKDERKDSQKENKNDNYQRMKTDLTNHDKIINVSNNQKTKSNNNNNNTKVNEEINVDE